MQRTAASQYVTTETLKREELSEGDLVFFKIKVPRISHVGVYLKNNFFVHASSSRGVMISNLNSSYWSRYFAGGGRVL
jgi:lipoprotein Spr